MKTIIISPDILLKLRDKHAVSKREVEQCFENKCGDYLIDEREDHRTDPPTLWFIAPTNRGRLLKVAFMFRDGNIHLKSTFEPYQSEIDDYEENGK